MKTLCILLLMGWGICLKVTLKTHVDGGMSRPVKRAETGNEDPIGLRGNFILFFKINLVAYSVLFPIYSFM